MSIRRVAVAATVALALALPVAPAPAQQGAPGPDRAQRAGKKAPPLAPAARDALTRALNRGRVNEAEYALHRVRSLFDIKRVRREFGEVEAPDGREATMLFRDLAVRVNELEGNERETAELLLARPDEKHEDDGPIGNLMKYGNEPAQTLCADPPVKVCVHWVEGGPHATPAGQPDETMATLTKVWNDQITDGGFRAPKPDHKPPGQFKDYLDVYLANIGGVEIYGYCTSDDPNLDKIRTGQYPYFDISAYCVLDNDYAENFFGDPLEALQVTAAHEFFHAVQFAYDAFEDFWLMEGTAAAVEDHVYDDINDNYQFLRASQLVKPHFPTDLTHEGSEHAFMNRYGAWVFWRFLSERLGDRGVPNMSVLKDLWVRADAAEPADGEPEPPDDFSAQAAVNVAKSDGAPFKRMFVDYGIALRLPEEHLSEGAGYVAFLDARDVDRKTKHRTIRLRPGAPRAGRATKVNHLAHKYVSIFKNKATANRRMRVIVDLPPTKRGSKATLLPFKADGTFLGPRRIGLDWRGDGRITVGPKVRRAVVVLTNASTRFEDCWRFPPFEKQVSCAGRPRDNGLTYRVKARLLN